MKKKIFKKNRLVILALSVMIRLSEFQCREKRRPVAAKGKGDKCGC